MKDIKIYYENNSQKTRTQRTYIHMDFILVFLIFLSRFWLLLGFVCLYFLKKNIQKIKKCWRRHNEQKELYRIQKKKKKTPQFSEVTILFNIFLYIFFCFLWGCRSAQRKRNENYVVACFTYFEDVRCVVVCLFHSYIV